MKTYEVKVIREAGEEPETNQFYPREEQRFNVKAPSRLAAYFKASLKNNINARGQQLKIYIDNEEYCN